MWLNELKIALIQKDISKLEALVGDLPTLKKREEIDEALHLLATATAFLIKIRNETQNSMVQIQKNIGFLKSTQAPLISKLNISS